MARIEYFGITGTAVARGEKRLQNQRFIEKWSSLGEKSPIQNEICGINPFALNN
jgi:hypothetical protein